MMQFSIVILLLISTLFLPNASGEDYTLWHLPKEAKRRIGKGWVSGNIAFSPDDNLIAVPSSIGTWIYHAQTGEALNLFTGHIDIINTTAFSPDGKILATGGSYEDKIVRLWDIKTGTSLTRLSGHTGSVNSIAFSPDGQTLATAGGYNDYTVRLWEVQTGNPKRTLFGHVSSVASIAFSPDGKILATGGNYTDKTIQLWDVETGTHRETLRGHTTSVSRIAFSPDGKTLVSADGGEDAAIHLWNVATGTLKSTLTGYSYGVVNSVAFKPDSTILISGSNATICQWNTTNGTHTTALAPTVAANYVTFSSDGSQFASSSGSDVILWDTASLTEKLKITGHLPGISAIAFSPDSRTLASAGWDQKVRLWDIATGENRAVLVGHTSNIGSVAFSPDGKTLASSGSWIDLTIRLWDTATGTQKKILIGQLRRIGSVVFSPDGKTLASASDDAKVCLWDVETGYNQATLSWHNTNSTSRLAFNPDGHILAIGGRAGIRLWDTNRPYQIRWTLHTPVESFAYSPDEKTLAGGKRDGTIILWDVVNREEKATLRGHTEWVGSVDFSPDGKTLASTGLHTDKTIRLWDVATASHKLTLTGHTERIARLAFSPDGKTLASASSDGTILLWEYPLAQRTAGAPAFLTEDTNNDQVLNAVLQNYPNPFNPETWIPYQLEEPAEVAVRIYTAKGTLIRTLAVGHRPAGIHKQREDAVYWDGKNEFGEPVASSVYFYTLTAGDFTATRKMVIRK